MNYRLLRPADIQILSRLLDLYISVFEDNKPPADRVYLSQLINNPAVLYFIAEQEGELVGGATCHLLPSTYGPHSELYLFDMAVATAHQRQGIGSGLLSFIRKYSLENEISTIYVQADADDRAARNFYLKNGGRESDVRHYDFIPG